MSSASFKAPDRRKRSSPRRSKVDKRAQARKRKAKQGITYAAGTAAIGAGAIGIAKKLKGLKK